MLQYKIHVRPLTQADASKGCPFPIIDDQTYAAHLGALIEDIASLPEIKSAPSPDGNVLLYSTLNEHELRNRMKYLFSREFSYIRFINIETLNN